MEKFTNAIREAVKDENWFAGLFLALCMPDICATIETPQNNNVGERYKRWFNANLADIYLPMFSADDCYYFRCSCLHQGLDIHTKLNHDRIHFITPPPNNNIIHRNKLNNILQMQIDIFCQDMALSVDLWYENIAKKDVNMQSGIDNLIKIHNQKSLEPFISFGL